MAPRLTDTTYLHYDHLGSTIALTNDAGQVTGRAFYSAYGLTVASSGTLNTPFLWQGAFGIQTDPNGLLYMRARYYHRWLGRFISEDPLGLAAGPNVFAYASGNPVMRTDSSGLWFGIDDLLFTAGGAAVGILGQGVSDLVGYGMTGQWSSSWENYAGAAAGGAIGGELLLYVGPGLAAVAGTVSGNAITQVLNNKTGKQDGYSATSILTDTAFTVVTAGAIPPSIAGVNVGQGSLQQVMRQIVTKAKSGIIDSISLKTAVKMLGSQAPDQILGALAEGGASGIIDSVRQEITRLQRGNAAK